MMRIRQILMRAGVLALLGSSVLNCHLALVPCESWTYVLVEHEEYSVVRSNSAPEVSATAMYRQALPTIRTIGLQYPDDNCRTETAAVATGQSQRSDTDAIMGTQCGVWLAELERALVDQKYKVISWSAIRQEQQTKHISTSEAARSLGADVVFVVNSMETNDIKRDRSAARRTAYFASDAEGTKNNSLSLDRPEREPLRRFVAEYVARMNPDGVLGWAGTLDITAVLATTGESIWFFRHSIARPRALHAGIKFLFRKREGDTSWRPVTPDGIGDRIAIEGHTSEDVEHLAEAGGPMDPFKAEKHELARSVARRCVQRFHRP